MAPATTTQPPHPQPCTGEPQRSVVQVNAYANNRAFKPGTAAAQGYLYTLRLLRPLLLLWVCPILLDGGPAQE